MACPRRFLNDNMTDWTTISWWIAGQIDISCWFHLIWWLNHHFSRWKKSTEEESPPLAASPASSSSGMLSEPPKGDDKLCEPPMGISMGTGYRQKFEDQLGTMMFSSIDFWAECRDPHSCSKLENTSSFLTIFCGHMLRCESWAEETPLTPATWGSTTWSRASPHDSIQWPLLKHGTEVAAVLMRLYYIGPRQTDRASYFETNPEGFIISRPCFIDCISRYHDCWW